jgi:hypothetical protein
MKKFWEWMNSKSLGFTGEDYFAILNNNGEDVVYSPDKVILIGYMEQYIYEELNQVINTDYFIFKIHEKDANYIDHKYIILEFAINNQGDPRLWSTKGNDL